MTPIIIRYDPMAVKATLLDMVSVMELCNESLGYYVDVVSTHYDYSDITGPSRRLKSPTTGLFVQQPIQANNMES